MSQINPIKVIKQSERSPLHKRIRLDVGLISDGIEKRWSLLNNDLVLHDVFDHGVGRLDCDNEDIFTDTDDTIFNKNDPDTIDVSCVSMTPNTREKQLHILESALTKEALEKLIQNDAIKELPTKPLLKPTVRTSFFDMLSDEVILHIFRWLPKMYLASLGLVSRRFYRLTQDESLWTRMDVSNRLLEAGELGKIMSKQMIILRLARSEIQDPAFTQDVKAFAPDFGCRIHYLDLSMATISIEALTMLFSRCRRLKKLSLENVPVNDDVLIALSGNRDIEVINFAMSTGITEDGMRYLLTNCRKIRELNIAWTYLNTACIKYICENLPASMDRLNFSGCRKLMSDMHVADLVSSCPRLRELDLSDCTVLTGETVRQITMLDDLNFLALSRCYLITYRSIIYLHKLYSLSYLDIHGGYIDDSELKVIKEALGDRVEINRFKFSSIARPTVGLRRSSVWNMRVRD